MTDDKHQHTSREVFDALESSEGRRAPMILGVNVRWVTNLREFERAVMDGAARKRKGRRATDAEAEVLRQFVDGEIRFSDVFQIIKRLRAERQTLLTGRDDEIGRRLGEARKRLRV